MEKKHRFLFLNYLLILVLLFFSLKKEGTIPSEQINCTCTRNDFNARHAMQFSLGRLKVAQLVKMPFIVFLPARLIFTGQANHLDIL